MEGSSVRQAESESCTEFWGAKLSTKVGDTSVPMING